MSLVMVGSIWRNPNNHRSARVHFVSGPPWNIVQYRYLTPRVPKVPRKRRRKMCERVNLATMTFNRFTEVFIFERKH